MFVILCRQCVDKKRLPIIIYNSAKGLHQLSYVTVLVSLHIQITRVKFIHLVYPHSITEGLFSRTAYDAAVDPGLPWESCLPPLYGVFLLNQCTKSGGYPAQMVPTALINMT